jgi:predicted metal-dependent hydrolase
VPNFHLRAAMLPPRMIEYVVAHELVHLLERTHFEAFWEQLERVVPDHAERQQWLREHGGMYDLRWEATQANPFAHLWRQR